MDISLPMDKIALPMDKISLPMEKISLPMDKIALPMDKIALPNAHGHDILFECHYMHRCKARQGSW